MRLVEPTLDGASRRLHLRFVRVRRNPDQVAGDDNRAAERQPERGPIPGVELDAQAGATAVGTIGRPDSLASAMIPSPATRARFGTSAVMATETPDPSWRISSRIASAPPL